MRGATSSRNSRWRGWRLAVGSGFSGSRPAAAASVQSRTESREKVERVRLSLDIVRWYSRAPTRGSPPPDLTPDPSPIAPPPTGRGAPPPVPLCWSSLVPPSPGGRGGDGRGGLGG